MAKRWKQEYYNPAFLMSGEISEKEIRAQYEKLRQIADEKLARFVGTEWENTAIYQQYANRFKPLDEIESPRELAYLLVDANRYLETELNSVWKLQRNRAQTIRTLKERGYTFVNKSNFNDFLRFMEDFRQKHLNRIYDSERVAELFATAKQKNISTESLQENFEYWIENTEKLEKLPRKKGDPRIVDTDLFAESGGNYGNIHRTAKRRNSK